MTKNDLVALGRLLAKTLHEQPTVERRIGVLNVKDALVEMYWSRGKFLTRDQLDIMLAAYNKTLDELEPLSHPRSLAG